MLFYKFDFSDKSKHTRLGSPFSGLTTFLIWLGGFFLFYCETFLLVFLFFAFFINFYIAGMVNGNFVLDSFTSVSTNITAFARRVVSWYTGVFLYLCITLKISLLHFFFYFFYLINYYLMTMVSVSFFFLNLFSSNILLISIKITRLLIFSLPYKFYLTIKNFSFFKIVHFVTLKFVVLKELATVSYLGIFRPFFNFFKIRFFNRSQSMFNELFNNYTARKKKSVLYILATSIGIIFRVILVVFFFFLTYFFISAGYFFSIYIGFIVLNSINYVSMFLFFFFKFIYYAFEFLAFNLFLENIDPVFLINFFLSTESEKFLDVNVDLEEYLMTYYMDYAYLIFYWNQKILESVSTLLIFLMFFLTDLWQFFGFFFYQAVVAYFFPVYGFDGNMIYLLNDLGDPNIIDFFAFFADNLPNFFFIFFFNFYDTCVFELVTRFDLITELCLISKLFFSELVFYFFTSIAIGFCFTESFWSVLNPIFAGLLSLVYFLDFYFWFIAVIGWLKIGCMVLLCDLLNWLLWNFFVINLVCLFYIASGVVLLSVLFDFCYLLSCTYFSLLLYSCNFLIRFLENVDGFFFLKFYTFYLLQRARCFHSQYFLLYTWLLM